MSFKVEQKIKNDVYVYEVKSYWNKEKKQPRQRRKYLGKKDSITGKIVDTNRKSKLNIPIQSLNYGNIYFLKEITKKLKLAQAIKESFPDDVEKIETLLAYILTEDKPYYMASQWVEMSYVDVDSKIVSSQRISELLKRVGRNEEAIEKFFRRWIKLQKQIANIYFDITSISSYSKELELAEWGYNRDKESIPQINIGILYGAESELPLYYKLYRGSISDVCTLKNVIKYNEMIGIKEVIYVLDRGFYSRSNIEQINDEKVIIPLSFNTKNSKKVLKDNLKSMNDAIKIFEFNNRLYYQAEDKVEIGEKMYKTYLFRDKEKHENKETKFYKILLEIEKEINENMKFHSKEEVEEYINEISDGYSKYYEIKQKDNQYIIRRNIAAITEKKEKFGTFILLTNIENKRGKEILQIYRSRDKVEKIFDMMKNDSGRNRLRVNQRERVNGNLFLIFLSLIISSHIEKIIRKSKDLRKYSKNEILFELKKLKITRFASGLHLLNEISKKQKDIFKNFNIPIPNFDS